MTGRSVLNQHPLFGGNTTVGDGGNVFGVTHGFSLRVVAQVRSATLVPTAVAWSAPQISIEMATVLQTRRSSG
jgi:hypothetical protein